MVKSVQTKKKLQVVCLEHKLITRKAPIREIDVKTFQAFRKKNIKVAYDKGEYDYEGDMAKSQLRSIVYNANMLHDMLEDDTNLPEWVQSKITLAEDYIVTSAQYMNSQKDGDN